MQCNWCLTPLSTVFLVVEEIELPKENHRAAASMTDDLYLGSSFI
jgi:hypothetical protein